MSNSYYCSTFYHISFLKASQDLGETKLPLKPWVSKVFNRLFSIYGGVERFQFLDPGGPDHLRKVLTFLENSIGVNECLIDKFHVSFRGGGLFANGDS